MNFGANVKKSEKSKSDTGRACSCGERNSCNDKSNWKGIRNPSVLVGFEIAKALEVSLDELCKGA